MWESNGIIFGNALPVVFTALPPLNLPAAVTGQSISHPTQCPSGRRWLRGLRNFPTVTTAAHALFTFIIIIIIVVLLRIEMFLLRSESDQQPLP